MRPSKLKRNKNRSSLCYDNAWSDRHYWTFQAGIERLRSDYVFSVLPLLFLWSALHLLEYLTITDDTVHYIKD